MSINRPTGCVLRSFQGEREVASHRAGSGGGAELHELSVVGENGIQILETAAAVQLAIVYNYLGFMILPLYVAFDRIDVRLREASKDLGAGRMSTFFSVTLPLAGPGIAAGVLLTFIPMCGDYVTATVLGGAKGNMIGAMIASQFSGAQNWPLGSAMAVLMIAAVLLTLVVACSARCQSCCSVCCGAVTTMVVGRWCVTPHTRCVDHVGACLPLHPGGVGVLALV
ncbi:MAG: ABC transporter permease [Actinobacteria bacterium]|nr:ABC transporter permease [Actinomycetota bacterium]